MTFGTVTSVTEQSPHPSWIRLCCLIGSCHKLRTTLSVCVRPVERLAVVHAYRNYRHSNPDMVKGYR
ncbi:hypothetical protein BABINDRAFT_161827 [Babjeviella inositovora NRRL Y-12698]|uniref:Uncharacterized protein n=1 Tax=Babjeviella inositovora NRRL Y-12698 TaxID=984486 RepID=A0A1E3QNY8_9ASCO|nr:uncharacterized protein BABINDRAFT_161827 [Babjeviella inositovora NRRL Y-12698]ODQ79426.1 hypothetical protein BABINDRAFT_161827 [Babjeviella inositovora NRRL Y-12698]